MTTDAGHSWTAGAYPTGAADPSGSRFELSSLDCPSAGRCYFVGTSARIVVDSSSDDYTQQQKEDVVLVSRDGGRSMALAADTGGWPTSISCGGKDACGRCSIHTAQDDEPRRGG